MESFFLAETTKYLYLLFDPENVLNNDGSYGTIIDTPNGDCLIEAGGYVFNTEAHPIDTGALNCCYNMRRQNLLADFDTDKFRGELYEYSSVADNVDEQRKDDRNNNVSTASATTTTATINIQTKVDPEETRKKIVAEIMNVLKENKFNRENAQIDAPVAPSTVGHVTTDDSIILPVNKPSKVINEVVSDGAAVEVVKLPPTRDSDDNKSSIQIVEPTDFIAYEEENISSESTTTAPKTPLASSDTANVEKQQKMGGIKQFKSPFDQEKYLEDHTAAASSNNSILTDFVHSILKSTLPVKPKFNPQNLLEKIRNNGINRTQSKNYKLLTCKAQPYLQRVTVLGEFY